MKENVSVWAVFWSVLLSRPHANSETQACCEGHRYSRVALPPPSLSTLLWPHPGCLRRAVVWREVWSEGQQNRERFFHRGGVTALDRRHLQPSLPLRWFSHLTLLGGYRCTLFRWRVRLQILSCGVSSFAELKYFLFDVCSATTPTSAGSRYTWGRRPSMKPMRRRNRSSRWNSW